MPRTATRTGTFSDWGEIAEFYDLLDIDRAPMIAFYRSLISEATHSLIELACGTGTIVTALATPLFESGRKVRVVGVDLSAGMLNLARAREPRIEWVLGDMRSPPIEGQLDLAICCFNSFQSLLTEDELSRALHSARRLLKPEGVFAFDMYQPNFSFLETEPADRLARSIVDQHGFCVQVYENYYYDPNTRVLTIDWRIMTNSGRVEPTPRHFRYYYRQYTASEIEQLLPKCGFVIQERYGNFDWSPLSAHSKKQILVCAPTAG